MNPADDRQAVKRVVTQRGLECVITNLRKAAVAFNVFQGARDACVNLKPMAMYMTEQELQQRAQVVAHVLRARAKIQLLSKRAARLRGDLDRFKVAAGDEGIAQWEKAE